MKTRNTLGEKLACNAVEYQKQKLRRDKLSARHSKLKAEVESVYKELRTSEDSVGQLQKNHSLWIEELFQMLKGYSEELASYDENGNEEHPLFEEGSVKKDKQRIAMYQRAVEEDPELAASIEAFYLEAKDREEERRSFGKQTAGIAVKQVDKDTLEIYVSVPYEKQEEGLMGEVMRTIRDAFIIEGIKAPKRDDYGGLLKLTTHNGAVGKLIDTLRQPGLGGESNISYEVIKFDCPEGIGGAGHREGECKGSASGEAQGNEKTRDDEAKNDEVTRGVNSTKQGEQSRGTQSATSQTDYIPIKHAAKKAGVSHTHLYKFLRGGKSARGEQATIEWQRKGGKTFVEEKSFDEWLAERQSQQIQDSTDEQRGTQRSDEIVAQEILADYITVKEARAVSGRSKSYMRRNLDHRGGQIKTKLFDGSHGKERYLERDSLLHFLEVQNGAVKMYNNETASLQLQQSYHRLFDKEVEEGECREHWETASKEWNLRTIRGQDGRKYFCEREMNRVLVNYQAKWRLDVLQNERKVESIRLQGLISLLGSSEAGVRQMVMNKKVELNDEGEATINSVGRFLENYYFSGEDWRKTK